VNLAESLGSGLTQESFLSYLFHPKTSKRPTGLRRHKVTSVRGGRKASRVRSYNLLDPVKQRVIDSVGREAYLRGDLTLTEAKRHLRPTAIELGVAKPVKSRASRRIAEDQAAVGIIRAASQRNPFNRKGFEKSRINPRIVRGNVKKLTPSELALARDITYKELEYRATKSDDPRYTDVVTGEIRNPWWYH
jgi:hypothetical protein